MHYSNEREAGGINRRGLLTGMAGGAALAAMGLGGGEKPAAAAEPTPAAPQLKGRIKQGVCGGVFGKTSLTFEQKCELCKQLGIVGMDFVGDKDWPTLKKYGLACTMARAGGGIGGGFNRRENHEALVAGLKTGIEAAAEAGWSNVICFSGNRQGLADDVGIEVCAEGLKKIAGFAEEKKINICMELLNSKRNHKDYQCDRTAWGAEMCKKVGSPRVKLLYDIYHMQVQEGDVIATIREFMPYIGHFHTAGVPGRHEVDDTQELYYPAIMRAIVDLKYEGYVSHEYGPTKDPLESLKKAVAICDV
jgi:hydroxypyruvate isomerase